MSASEEHMCCESIESEDGSELEYQEGFPGERAVLKGEQEEGTSQD